MSFVDFQKDLVLEEVSDIGRNNKNNHNKKIKNENLFNSRHLKGFLLKAYPPAF